jgi:hypothetical protein
MSVLIDAHEAQQYDDSTLIDGLGAAGYTEEIAEPWMLKAGNRRHLAAAFLGEFGGRRFDLPEKLGGNLSLAGSLILDSTIEE